VKADYFKEEARKSIHLMAAAVIRKRSIQIEKKGKIDINKNTQT